MFDLNKIVESFRKAFALIATKNEVQVDAGFKLFEETNNSLKGNDTVESENFKAVVVGLGLDHSVFVDTYNATEKKLVEHAEQVAAKREKAIELKKQSTKFSNEVKAGLEQAKTNGETSCVISYVSHLLFSSFSGHIGNRNVKDHVKGDYLKGKIDPVKRADFRKVTVLRLDKERNAALWSEIEQQKYNSLPYVLGDSHCRQYATCTAKGDEAGFRMEAPETWEVTVIDGLTDEQTVNYIRSRGSRDCLLCAKDERIIAMKEHKFNIDTASKFVLSPWKTAFKVVGVLKGDVVQGMREFKDAISAIDSLKISLAKGGKASQGVKATMLQTHKDCTDDKKALIKWVTFWSNFFNDEAELPKVVTKAVSKLGGSGFGSEAKTLEALLKVYGSVSVEDFEPVKEAA